MLKNSTQFIINRVSNLAVFTACVLLSSLGVANAQQRSVDSFFNAGANHYIDNQIEAAQKEVGLGLELYPQDKKLNGLKALLEQQQDKKDQKDKQNNKDKDKQQDKKDQKNKQNQNNQQDKQNQQDQKKKQDQQNKENKDKQNSEQQQNGDKQKQAKPEEISKQEAKMMLDAMKQQERADRDKMRIILGRPQKVDKDW